MSTVSERSWNSSDDYEDDNSINRSSVSRRAVEQIRLAEEVKITKEKIKEVEEEWQNNLLNWKSKRRQSRLTGGEESDSGDNQQRKVKTFSEILNEKAKSGHRIGYNLHKYIGIQDEEEEESLVLANNNTNNNNHKQGTGSSRVSNANNNLGDYHEDDESNQLKSYEHQQAELQKKRQELNNKLQELEQLEKKQNELERQERVSTSEVISSSSSSSSSPSPTTMATTKTTSSSSSSSSATLISPTVIVSIKNEESSINPSAGKVNSRNSDEIKQKQNDNFREKKVFNRNSSTDLSRRDQSSGESQPKTVTINENNRQKSVWNYLLQQQDDPRVVNHSHLSNQNIDPNQHHPSNRSNGRFNQLDSESEDDDHLNDSIYADEDAEKEQMLSFRAKLSTFESLSKCKPAPTQQQQQQNNHNNHNQHHQQQQQQQQTITSKPIRKSEKVKKTADQLTSRLFPSAASSLSSSLSLSSSSSSSSSVTLANNNNPSPSSSLSSSSTATPRTTTTTTGIPSTTVIMTNQNNNKEYENSVLMKNNRPPTAEDLAYKEEMKVFQQRLQNQNLADQQKHLLYASQSPLQANSFNTQQQQQHQHATLQHHHSHPQLHTFQQPLQQTQPLPRQLQQSATQLHHHQFQQQSSHQKQPNLIMLSSSQQTQPQQSSPYNINHWVIQEAELRRLHYTQQPQPQLQPQPQPQPQQTSPYNINHWVVQEAELRRLHHAQQQQQSTGPALMARSTSINRFPQSSQINPNISTNSNTYENHVYENSPFRGSHASGLNRIQNVAGADTTSLMKKSNGLQGIQPQPPPMQPLAQVQVQQQLPLSQPQQLHQLQSQGPLQLAQPLQSQQLLQSQQQLLQAQQQKQMLSVSGKKKCSNCGDELGRGCAAMVIETLALYYHINCFRCSVCHIQLGNGTCGTDVRVRNHKLHCHNCYSNDEAGLKFSRV
ncbi:putative uncharacterized protein DDB_G0271606 isoform X2 [Panonychus citri]|uniref:putative uncharacterized protein DDB_G0271606 isoform X2 n=1 Tax=Panonychus citri TaxID=50023 RepID=UPI0023082571|nr:putative uncharacterized protein DDB_G0271606 isoform X2 [Panonychus citri]